MPTWETGYTGHTIEQELFGENVKAERAERGEEYIQYQRALENVKRFQTESGIPYPPAKPDKSHYPVAYGLHREVAEQLGLTPEDLKQGKLKLYSALRTIFDKKHGVDVLLELETAEGQLIHVTLDVTNNPDKATRKNKADITMKVAEDGYDYDDPEDQRKIQELIESYGEEIAQQFQIRKLNIQSTKSKKVA